MAAIYYYLHGPKKTNQISSEHMENNNYENSLTVADSARMSFNTVKLKLSTANKKKTDLLYEFLGWFLHAVHRI